MGGQSSSESKPIAKEVPAPVPASAPQPAVTPARAAKAVPVESIASPGGGEKTDLTTRANLESAQPTTLGYSFAVSEGLVNPPVDYVALEVTRSWVERTSGAGQKDAPSAEAIENRVARVGKFDSKCYKVLQDVTQGELDAWKEHALLLPGEKELAALRIIAVDGFPAGEEGVTSIGDGWVVFTERPGKVESDRSNRLHMVMTTHSASFDGSEIGKNAKYTVKHGATTHCGSIDLNKHVYHARCALEDTTSLVASFSATPKKNCCEMLWEFLCAAFRCCVCNCCAVTLQDWIAWVTFTPNIEDRLTKVVEATQNKAEYKFPAKTVTGPENIALVMRQLHCVHLVLRNTADNTIGPCRLVVNPMESMTNVGRLTSLVSSCVASNPLPPNHHNQGLVGVAAFGSPSCACCGCGDWIRITRRLSLRQKIMIVGVVIVIVLVIAIVNASKSTSTESTTTILGY